MSFKKEKNSGFTLIEAIIVLFVFSLIAVTFYNAFVLGIKYVREAKFQLEAAAVANEKMEIIRNLDYDAIGTTTGVPQGDILATETVQKNTGTYYIYTFIKYIDDSYDGTQGGSPNDVVPNDYKKVRIKVAWENNPASDRSVSLFSNFVPNGLEADAGGGTFSINVLDNAGVAIPGATVRIENPSESIDITTATDDTGNITLPAMPVGDQNYSLKVSKSGIYSVQTYLPYPTSAFKPVDVHASISEGELNMKSIITDNISGINFSTQDPFGSSIANVAFNLEGGRKKGDTPDDPPSSIFEYDQDLDSGSSGERELTNMSSGLYSFTFINPTADYEFIKIDLGQDEANIFDLSPGTTMDVKAILAVKNINSLLVKVFNNSDNSAIEGATVNLKNETLLYDVTLTTDKYGMAYFPENLPELEAEDYQLKVSADGFQEDNSVVEIDNLIISEIRMNAN